jgi:hypothetical protein
MKKSSLQYVPSRLFSQRVLFFLLPLYVTLSVSGCRNRSSDQLSSPSESVTQAEVNARPLAIIKDPIKPSWIPLKDSLSDEEGVVAWISGQACIEDDFQLKISFLSGIYATNIQMAQKWGDLNSKIEVDGIAFQVQGGSFSQPVREQICSSVRAGSESVVIPAEVSSPFKSAVERTLASFITDCRSIEPTREGWVCSLSSLMPQTAITEVEEFQQAMIQKWSRQPYVLARRSGMTMTLARLATRMNDEAGVHKFCKLLQFSLPEEMTLVMTSSRWQKSLCDGNDRQRREAAFHGLAKSVAELSMIRQLYESASKVGGFSIRIPDADIPERSLSGLQPLRITISPEPEVTNRLVELAEEILGRQPQEATRVGKRVASLDQSGPQIEPRKTLCWHPVFSDTPALLKVADGMRLTGDGFRGECQTTEKKEQQSSANPLASYIMQSLTSETEFVMDNGQTKLLRLPEGKYQYKVQVLPQNPIDADEVVDSETPSSAGIMDWGSTRDQVIRAWK